jgi:hypothetical protein
MLLLLLLEQRSGFTEMLVYCLTLAVMSPMLGEVLTSWHGPHPALCFQHGNTKLPVFSEFRQLFKPLGPLLYLVWPPPLHLVDSGHPGGLSTGTLLLGSWELLSFYHGRGVVLNTIIQLALGAVSILLRKGDRKRNSTLARMGLNYSQ